MALARWHHCHTKMWAIRQGQANEVSHPLCLLRSVKPGPQGRESSRVCPAPEGFMCSGWLPAVCRYTANQKHLPKHWGHTKQTWHEQALHCLAVLGRVGRVFQGQQLWLGGIWSQLWWKLNVQKPLWCWQWFVQPLLLLCSDLLTAPVLSLAAIDFLLFPSPMYIESVSSVSSSRWQRFQFS